MSRHRNIRSINVNEEYEGYDDVYGHSVEDDYCVSPSEAAFVYDREGSKSKQKISAFFQSVTEENEEPESREANLSEIDKARLESCIEQINQVLGCGISRQELINIILLYNFNVEKAINFILGCPQYKHVTEKKGDALLKKSFTIPKLNAKIPMNFKREPLKADSSSFSSFNELSRSHLLSVSPNTVKFIKPRLCNDVGKLAGDLRKVNVSGNRSEPDTDNVLDSCHVDLTKALRVVTSAPQLRASEQAESETFTPDFIDCEIVIAPPQAKTAEVFGTRKLLKKIGRKKVSAFGKALCLRYSRPVPFVSHISDRVYSGIPQFLFNCPSPDDIRISSLHNRLKLQK
uniref:HBS1-like protein N-terminal domain-containing protein n=1 Tax=Photinus pyralis TaxID=7054 RepID=A0A1Y1M393_PHOPY